MNPFTQSKRYDSDGDYIRRWVPELESLDGKAIHEPHSLKDRDNGLFADLNYPEPIADHKAAREHAIETFRKLKKG
jgi:deoxyribodipyrimidine photo-lyase